MKSAHARTHAVVLRDSSPPEHIDNYDAPFAQQFLVIATDMAGVAQKTIAQLTEVAADLAVLVPAFAQAVNGK